MRIRRAPMAGLWAWCWLTALPVALAQTAGWHVASASYRVLIQKTAEARWPADVGEVSVCPVGVDPLGCTVAVFAENGQPVGSQVYWAAPGTPVKILFDTSSQQANYFVYLSQQPLAFAVKWTPPPAGLMLESRRRPPGEPDSWKHIQELWQKAGPAEGRCYLPSIFEGLNPLGLSTDFMTRYKGYFVAPKDGGYQFATVSDDASVLLIDGKVVVEWPGWHGWDGGRWGEHHGGVKLTAGRHEIEYFWVQGDGPCAAIAAWRPPGADRWAVMPADAFVPVASFAATQAEAALLSPSFTYFDWAPASHCLVDNLAMVEMKLRVLSPRTNAVYRWTFDDGGSARGAEVTHLFLRPALRKVELEASGPDRPPFAVTQMVAVHPRWTQRHEWPDGLFDKYRDQILKRDPLKLPLADLAYSLQFAEAAQDEDLLTFLGNAGLKRTNEFSAQHAGRFLALGAHFAGPEIRAYDAAEKSYRTAVALNATDPVIREGAKLKLAKFLLDCTGKTAEATEWLSRIDPNPFNDTQRRELALVRADALLARGEIENARAQYRALGHLGDADEERFSLLLHARLESARDYLRRGDYETAAELVRSIEWEAPLERLSPATGLVLVKVFLGRKEYPRALTRCQRLLAVTNNDNLQAEVLLDLVEVQRAMGLKQLADASLAKLLSEHPYSEAAALAKDRWGKAVQK